MAIIPSRGTSRVPLLRLSLLPNQPPGVSKGLFRAYLSRLIPIPRLIYVLLGLIALPPSPTSPSPTSIIGGTRAVYSEADYAPTCAYRLLSFPIVNLAHIYNITLSHCFFSDDALNPSCIIASVAHAFVPGIAVSTSGHHFKPHPLSTIICPRRTIGPSLFAEHVRHVDNANDPLRNSNPNTTATLSGCRSSDVMALFKYVIVSHDNSTVTSIGRTLSGCRYQARFVQGHPTVYLTFVDCQEYGDEVKADAMLHDIMRWVSVPPATNSLMTNSRPSYRQSLIRPFACIYTLLPTNEIYILLYFLALPIVSGHSGCPLAT
jgi:hypothetical protein